MRKRQQTATDDFNESNILYGLPECSNTVVILFHASIAPEGTTIIEFILVNLPFIFNSYYILT